jgi:hypothetical protein
MTKKRHNDEGRRKAPPGMLRRTFLATGIVALGASAFPFLRTRDKRHFTGGIVGANSALGHAMRDGKFPASSETAETGVVIVGGGIGGLAAARQFDRRGRSDFVLLELDSRTGGNAVSGENKVSAYPWGAHYVPICNDETKAVAELFRDLGVITGRNADGLPVYDEEYLCADPMERLFIHGRWQEGFVPQIGITNFDHHALDSFHKEMERMKVARGHDGRRAFAIPLEESSRDAQFIWLDSITMSEYLQSKGWLNSPTLRWYVNYCCRDDYGAGIEQVSAWAGIHYFASRNGRAANSPSYGVVTWPEGNGWLVRQIQTPLQSKIRTSCAVWNVETVGNRVAVDYYDVTNRRSVRLMARGVIWAAPHFVARRAIRALREDPPAGRADYSPWMVANLTLDAMPKGHDYLAWDNVLYASRSLGYVVATHQNLDPVPQRTVLTYYQPLDDNEPAAARQKAMARSYEDWCESILADLRPAHPDLQEHLVNLDVWLWGHAMVRPVPGFIWGAARQKMLEPLGNIVFAHSDMSGISIFEEAYTRGRDAADTLLKQSSLAT